MKIVKNAFRMGGKACYEIRSKKDQVLGRIRFFCSKELNAMGRNDVGPHWALEHASGRIDRRDTLVEIRDECSKSYLGV